LELFEIAGQSHPRRDQCDLGLMMIGALVAPLGGVVRGQESAERVSGHRETDPPGFAAFS
jgi:hypothetical protein